MRVWMSTWVCVQISAACLAVKKMNVWGLCMGLLFGWCTFKSGGFSFSRIVLLPHRRDFSTKKVCIVLFDCIKISTVYLALSVFIWWAETILVRLKSRHSTMRWKLHFNVTYRHCQVFWHFSFEMMVLQIFYFCELPYNFFFFFDRRAHALPRLIHHVILNITACYPSKGEPSPFKNCC